uniref:Uncharacterized protein n=1 Tax=Tanacetum cinerariifolium TaxID=118510 RepID=A0A699UWY3_TANCI|nr:hypothetical protein [Tanacetum cinerariifolium]
MMEFRIRLGMGNRTFCSRLHCQAKEKGCCLSSDIVADCSEGRGRNPTSSRRYTELLAPILESQQVPQNDNNVISEVTDAEQDGETV